MFEWVKNGKLLNEVIDTIIGIERNKTKSGITEFLSNRKYSRDEFDASAVIMTLTAMKNSLKSDGKI